MIIALVLFAAAAHAPDKDDHEKLPDAGRICCICLDEFDAKEKDWKLVPCRKHFLHKNCYDEMVESAIKAKGRNAYIKCPECRFESAVSAENNESYHALQAFEANQDLDRARRHYVSNLTPEERRSFEQRGERLNRNSSVAVSFPVWDFGDFGAAHGDHASLFQNCCISDCSHGCHDCNCHGLHGCSGGDCNCHGLSGCTLPSLDGAEIWMPCCGGSGYGVHAAAAAHPIATAAVAGACCICVTAAGGYWLNQKRKAEAEKEREQQREQRIESGSNIINQMREQTGKGKAKAKGKRSAASSSHSRNLTSSEPESKFEVGKVALSLIALFIVMKIVRSFCGKKKTARNEDTEKQTCCLKKKVFGKEKGEGDEAVEIEQYFKDVEMENSLIVEVEVRRDNDVKNHDI